MNNTAHLYFTYCENGEKVVRGPFFTASPDQRGADGSICYSVQNEHGTFEKIILPRYHLISAVLTADGRDIT